MISQQLTIINKLGLHARAAAKLATTCNKFSCQTQMLTNGKSVDCKSVMSLMLLAAAKGTEIEIQCDGDDENSACEAICQLINNRFDEEE